MWAGAGAAVAAVVLAGGGWALGTDRPASRSPAPVRHSDTAFLTPGALTLEACVGVPNGICRATHDRALIADVVDATDRVAQEQLPIPGCPNQDGLPVTITLT
ncbi:MAG: hypothetical protein JWN17_1901 [Frankiales bacterium]|nr:hypothetical protein [Frankiales bacterium]